MSYLIHYGTPRHSGRYPWGSGENPYQRNKSFLGYCDELKKQGLSEVEIAKAMGMNTAELRRQKSLARSENKQADITEAIRLKEKGYSNVAIGDRMGISESQVRNLLKDSTQRKVQVTKNTADILKDNVDKYGYIDVGLGTEQMLGVSRTKLKTAISSLEAEGYKVHKLQVLQVGTGKKTNMYVLGSPDSSFSEVAKDKTKIHLVEGFSEDKGETFRAIKPPVSIDSRRVKINYSEDGGKDKDGVIELRRGVDDISLGNAKYAQVRIAVDGTHYMKGMAMYSDDLPDGIDIMYNTNKKRGTPKEDVFKKMKDDPDNPFGAITRQRYYTDKNGKEHQSVLNIVGSKDTAGEEGAWGEWSKSLSAQMLSKQSPKLAKQQLDLAYKSKYEEYQDILKVSNPTIRKALLVDFADGCDSAAVHLKAAALPRQASHVILPLPKMKDTEIYAPNYRDGEKVVLIRYPHGGIFEIPELTVNNKNKDGKRLLGDAKDAVGINPKVAERLSGADFDGDTVLVIPNNNRAIKTSAPLKGLKDFDPKIYQDMSINVKNSTKQMKMGEVSNLITDMTIKGASESEIARAVRHSMVVIDSEKHHLNYKQSYIDNGIAELKEKYQGGARHGASTLISKAASEVRVPEREARGIDKDTGEIIYVNTGRTYKDSTGASKIATQKSTLMYERKDARTLSSGTQMEDIYAEHANKLKALGNEARKTYISTKGEPVSKSAAITYKNEVDSLKSKLSISEMNSPLERQAQIVANTIVKAKKEANPDMNKEELKKVKTQALMDARERMGAKRQNINITPKEWEAIQAGAISSNTLTKILDHTDKNKLKELATPRIYPSLTPSTLARAQSMVAAGYTRSEIADALGISTTTLIDILN